MANVTVFLDVDGDGALDAGEPFVVTDGSGNFDFANLVAGDYVVDVDDTTLPPGFILTTGSDTLSISLASGEDFNDADFGYQAPGIVTGHLFIDVNSNGVQDASEVGLAGVDIIITDSNLDQVTVTTDANGDYQASIPPGSTTLDVDDTTLPPAAVLTTANDPQVATVNSGAVTASAAVGYHVPGPYLSQIHYRWRNDDGRESNPVFNVYSYRGNMGAQSSVAVPITAVANTDRAFILAPTGKMSVGVGSGGGRQNANEVLTRARFTAADQVTLTRGVNTGDSAYSFFVIEDTSGNEIYVKSGSATFTNTTAITDTDLDINVGAGITDYTKTVVFLTVSSNSASRSYYNQAHVRGYMTSDTNLALRRQAGNSSVTLDWFVVEFKGSGWSVQQGDFPLNTGTHASPETQTISSVNLSESFVFMNWQADTNGLDQASPKVELANSTTLQFSRQDTAVGICQIRYFVVSHSDLDVQRGDALASAADATLDQPIASINTSQAFPITFNDCNGTGDYFPRPNWRAVFADSTTLRWGRSFTGQDSNFFWQVIDLSGFFLPGATFAAGEDVKLTGLAKQTPMRLRIMVSNEGSGDSGGERYQLYVAETTDPTGAACPTESYLAVEDGAETHWEMVDSSYISDGEPTFNIDPGLTDEATTFVTGELKDTGDTTTGSIALAIDAFTEIEYSIQATAAAPDAGEYCFKLVKDGTPDTDLDAYAIYGQVNLAGATAVDLLSFEATGEGSSVKVAWQTANEINNMGFYLYRADTKDGPVYAADRQTDTGCRFYHFRPGV